MVKHNPEITSGSSEDVLTKISLEIEKESYISALLLESTAIEAYLANLIIITNPLNNENKTIVNDVRKIRFNNLLSINFVLGYINYSLYKKLHEFFDVRNEFAHYLIGIDFNDKETKNELKSLVNEGIKLCKEVSQIYIINRINKIK